MSKLPIGAVVLAGSRPGGDPLAQLYDVEVKSLVPVADQPMLSHVARSLFDCPAIDQILILAQTPELLVNDTDTEWIAAEQKIKLAESKSTIACSMDALMADEDTRFPLLVTTADNVLVENAMIDHLAQASDGADIAIAVVERSVLLARYPASKRTWLKFRGGHYSGANLFYFGSQQARDILKYWAEVEQDRKKGWKMLTIFGPWLLFLAITRMLSIEQLAARVGKKTGLDIRIVQMPQAEACIDVDNPADLEMAEQILAARL